MRGTPAGDESHGVACYAKQLIAKKGHKPGDVLILSPRRTFAYGMRDALTEQDVPSHSFHHGEALEADEARQAFACLLIRRKALLGQNVMALTIPRYFQYSLPPGDRRRQPSRPANQ